MTKRISAPLSLALLLALLTLALSGCAVRDEKGALNGTAENDILTFQSNLANKSIVRIGMQYYTPDDALARVLGARFPEHLFVMDYSAAAGTDLERRMEELLRDGAPLDIVVSGKAFFQDPDAQSYVDLSPESFLDSYLLSALNNVSQDGHIYFLPGISTVAGIAYNTRMFEEHGWQVPTNTEEFFALCEAIRAEGIAPFACCLKYASQSNALFATMCYDQLYMSAEGAGWLYDLQMGRATYAGHMEPFYELAKRFADAGIATIEDFSASLTQKRQAFWAGEYAMMFANSAVYSYAEAEGAPFAVGIMPFPAERSEDSGFAITPSHYLAIPKAVEKSPERLKLIKEVLAFLSSPEGQGAMLAGGFGLSNVRGVDISENPAFQYVKEAYERGNIYPAVSYEFTDVNILNLQSASIRTLFEGGSVEDAIAEMDASLRLAFESGAPAENFERIATAEESFTMLETSFYMAEQLKKAASADIGVVINGGYFLSNLATIGAGEITSDMRRFIMKGAGAEDWLTTYSLTGAQIRAFMERPIVNGAEIDALVAASGLKMVYAPWNERGERVLELTLSDGAPLLDGQIYTVAAWKGVIDDRYVTRLLETHEALGPITDIMAGALKRDGSIRPDIAGKITLVWPEG